MTYNWQYDEWPNFTFDLKGFQQALQSFTTRHGKIAGMLKALPPAIEESSVIDLMVSEALTTSAIEGEYFSREDVLSSIRQKLGLQFKNQILRDKHAKGVARLMVLARDDYDELMSKDLLCKWHNTLMHSYSGINTGSYRSSTDPMRIISGRLGKEIIHFEAPPSGQVAREMQRFILWYNQEITLQNDDRLHPAVFSAIAHVYFESIHPFEDGNGLIGRAISEKALAQSVGRPILLNISKPIQLDRKNYYSSLKRAQSSLEITEWIAYFIDVLKKAQDFVESQITSVVQRTIFFDTYKEHLNSRQHKVLRKMLQALPDKFEGGMSNRKYVSITGASKATSNRDIISLEQLGILKKVGAGRSTNYELNLELLKK